MVIGGSTDCAADADTKPAGSTWKRNATAVLFGAVMWRATFANIAKSSTFATELVLITIHRLNGSSIQS